MLDGVQARLLLQAIGLWLIVFAGDWLLPVLVQIARLVIALISGTYHIGNMAGWSSDPFGTAISFLISVGLPAMFLIAGFRLLFCKGYLFPIMVGMLTR